MFTRGWLVWQVVKNAKETNLFFPHWALDYTSGIMGHTTSLHVMWGGGRDDLPRFGGGGVEGIWTVLYCTVLYCVVLCRVVSCCVVLCFVLVRLRPMSWKVVEIAMSSPKSVVDMNST